MKKLIKQGFIRNYDITYKTKTGKKIPVSFSGAVMYEPERGARNAERGVGKGKTSEFRAPSSELEKVPSSKIVGIAHDMRQIKRFMEKEENLVAVAVEKAEAEKKRAKELQVEISERKKAEKALQEGKEFHKALFEYNPVETIVVDTKGQIIDFNLAKRKSGGRLPNIGDVCIGTMRGSTRLICMSN